MILSSTAPCSSPGLKSVLLLSTKFSDSLPVGRWTPTVHSQAKTDLQANLFRRRNIFTLPSPPESPSMYSYSSTLGERSRYATRLTSRHVLPAPSVDATLASAESVRQASVETMLASQFQEKPLPDGSTPPYSSNLQQVAAVKDFNSVSSRMKAPRLPPLDQGRREYLLKQRPPRASSTASYPTPQLVLTEAEYQSEDDEVFTGSEEEEYVADGTVVTESSVRRLANKRKMKRFRSAQTLSYWGECSLMVPTD